MAEDANKKDQKDTGGMTDYNRQVQEAMSNGPWWAILISGIVVLAFGILILSWPLMTLTFLLSFFGALAIIFGALGIIRSLFLIKKDKRWWILLIEGILGIIIGIMVFVWPFGTTIFLVYFIASWLIITGITGIAFGSKGGNSLAIVNGVVSLILGIFIFFRPPIYATTTLLLFIGIFAIFRGISLIVTSIVVAVAKNKAKKAAVA